MRGLRDDKPFGEEEIGNRQVAGIGHFGSRSRQTSGRDISVAGVARLRAVAGRSPNSGESGYPASVTALPSVQLSRRPGQVLAYACRARQR
jgi:hypothetical protein